MPGRPFSPGAVMLFGEDFGGGTVAAMIASFVAAFGGLAALVTWIVRKLFDTTLPDLQKTFTASVASLTQAFLEEGRDARGLFREQVKEERADCDRRAGAILERQQQSHAEYMQSVRDQARGREEAVAMLRGIHQTLVHGTRLAELVRAADDAIWTKTLAGVITSWNRAAEQLLGWRAGEVVGQSVYAMIPTDLHEAERDVLDRIRRGERVEHYNTERLTRDGRRVRVSVSLAPISDPSGVVISVGTIARGVP